MEIKHRLQGVISPEAVKRATELSETKNCSVGATIVKTAKIDSTFDLVSEPALARGERVESMKKFSLLFTLWVCISASRSPAQQGTAGSGAPAPHSAKVLTLSEAVQIALKNNPAVGAADAYAEAVRQGIKTAQSGRYPRLDFSYSFTRSNNPVYVFGTLLTQEQFQAQNFDLNFLNHPPPLNNFRPQFTANMPLYDAGKTSRSVRDACLQSQAAQQGMHRTQQEIVFNTAGAFLNELLARESVRVAQAALDAATADLARAQSRQEQGLTVPSDVLSAQVQLSQAKEDLIRAQNAVAIAQASLNVAMGLPEDAPNEIEGDLKEVSFESGALSERQEKALVTRPDYQQAKIGKERTTNGVNAARAEFLPKINLFSSWEVDSQTFAARAGNNWAAGATLSFNIFDGGANRARLAESRARERQARALQDQMASAVRLQVREAFLNVNAARQRVEASRESASQAQESLRILQNRYETGLATITDLLQAETMRTAAQQRFLNAVFDYRIAFAALELATGEISSDSQVLKR
jgi:outer membrane protein TolC